MVSAIAVRPILSRRALTLVSLATAALLASGCASGARSSVQRPNASASASTLTVPTTKAGDSGSGSDAVMRRAVLTQYAAFWRALPTASAASDELGRFKALVATTTDPELGQLVKNFGKQRADGKQLYGRDVPRPNVVSLTSNIATITDCQDSSRSGLRDIKTGHKLTSGVARNPVDATLLNRGGVWKVSAVHYRPDDTC